MYYFGYGSNMLTARLQARVPSAHPVATARLEGYALHFHKWSRDESGKCNITPAPEATVHGVVFEVDPAELDALDEAEQRGRGYTRQEVHLQGPNTPSDAFAYVAQPAYVDDALLPYDWYHGLVLAGAQQHDLPPDYIAMIEAVRSYPDPNEKRRRKHRILLKEAGYPLLRR
jgi:gamma-glutamylcyclotransferase (GGCT)/AIG2-like uncharacterized protein YtfP